MTSLNNSTLDLGAVGAIFGHISDTRGSRLELSDIITLGKTRGRV